MNLKKYVLWIFCVISITTIDIQTSKDDRKAWDEFYRIKKILELNETSDGNILSDSDILSLEEQLSKLPELPLDFFDTSAIALRHSLPNYLNYRLRKGNFYNSNQSAFELLVSRDILKLLNKAIANPPNLRIRDIQTIQVLTRKRFNWDLYLHNLSMDNSKAAQLIQESLQKNVALQNAMYPPHPGVLRYLPHGNRPGAVRLPSSKGKEIQEQTWWDKTKQTWENVKAEIPNIVDRMPDN
ncbi:hypothetical protein KBD08_00600 [Candidatus Babeliales bacterium]|nr:hypothetical protein [Candidatus Babeliales bacterium]